MNVAVTLPRDEPFGTDAETVKKATFLNQSLSEAFVVAHKRLITRERDGYVEAT